jgi:hypothetical protein
MVTSPAGTLTSSGGDRNSGTVSGLGDVSEDTVSVVGGTTGSLVIATGASSADAVTAAAEAVWAALKACCVKSPDPLGTFDAPSRRRASMPPPPRSHQLFRLAFDAFDAGVGGGAASSRDRCR